VASALRVGILLAVVAVVATGCGASGGKRNLSVAQVEKAFAANGASKPLLLPDRAGQPNIGFRVLRYDRETLQVFVLPQGSDARRFSVQWSGVNGKLQRANQGNVAVVFKGTQDNRRLVNAALHDLR
jgi:hypothetical protein